ncbi:hypothetical protein ABZS29_30885 [Kribbella sp. NPDC005582]|uniref:peptidase MA family metallohydrolase n=1 Tax=Kribbella sp. NPDC005582 TaxID=3156893 RepID=UPI0033BEB843
MKHKKRLVAGVAALAVASAAGVAVVWNRQSGAVAPPGAVAVAAEATATPAELTDALKKVRRTEVDALLATRATAVLKGDLRGFLAAVDPKQPKLVARQRMLFTNLQKFGLRQLAYTVAEERHSPEVAQKFGATGFRTRVMMRYQLTGLDPKPVRTDLGYTFVKRDGRWILVEDNAIDTELSRDGHRQPWDYQEVAVVRNGKVVVVVDKRELALGQKIAKISKASVDGVRRHWAGGWDGSVMVVAMPEARVLSVLWVSGNGRGWTIAGTAVPTYDEDPVSPGRTAAVSTRIVINPQVRKGLTKDLLVHEMTHAATQRVGRQGPMWLVEGFAEYVRCAVIEDDPHWTVDPYRKRVRTTLASMKALPGPAEFAAAGDRSYGQSWWVLEYLVDRLGEKKVAALYADLAAHATGADAILKKHTQMTPAQLLAAVRKFRG